MLKPWVIIKILEGHLYNGDPLWVRYLIWDWHLPRIADSGHFRGQYLFDATSEKRQSITGPCPMGVPLNRIMCNFQHDETGRITETTLDKHPGERWTLISYPFEDYPIPTSAEKHIAKVMAEGGKLRTCSPKKLTN
jgi:hypothetical protein